MIHVPRQQWITDHLINSIRLYDCTLVMQRNWRITAPKLLSLMLAQRTQKYNLVIINFVDGLTAFFCNHSVCSRALHGISLWHHEYPCACVMDGCAPKLHRYTYILYIHNLPDSDMRAIWCPLKYNVRASYWLISVWTCLNEKQDWYIICGHLTRFFIRCMIFFPPQFVLSSLI